ncbi:hypothetical protein ACN47E_001959 [Coniothyrium glycines]
MAVTAVQTAMNLEGKTVHPFFSKPLVADCSNEQPLPIHASNDHAHDDADFACTVPQSLKEPKKRTRKNEAGKHKNRSSVEVKSQALLQGFVRATNSARGDTNDVGNDNLLGAPNLEEDPNQARRKRQKTTSPEPVTTQSSAQPQKQAVQGQPQLGLGLAQDDSVHSGALTSHPLSAAGPEIVVATSAVVAEEQRPTSPKKQIKVTKSGKLISSPPKPVHIPITTPKKRRGRPPKTQIQPTVTVIRYGAGLDAASKSALGQKIEDILNKPKRSNRQPTTRKVASKPTEQPKAPHPFFTGKSSQPTDVVSDKASDHRSLTPKKSAVTPGKLRAEALRDRIPKPTPHFGIATSYNRVSKQSGMHEPRWPTRESTHVRNLNDSEALVRLGDHILNGFALKPRKLKHNIIGLSEEEDIMTRLGKSLRQFMDEDEKRSIADFAPPEDVRLPKRLLTTGTAISDQVRQHIGPNDKGSHPAVTNLINSIEQTFTPFDEGRCEPQAWGQKYSPQCASDVLQIGQEPTILKNWLHGLTVLAVGGALKTSTVPDNKKPPKKKRKKTVDDFIVSDSEDQEDDLIEVGSHGSAMNTSLVIPSWTRNRNVVLVSGPHGCGKSAMVQAVAKELDFEVFEIHSGMRRSGKDIQDKVGDMTANHLVNHKRSTASVNEDVTTAENTDDERMGSALQDDLTSGRQGTMTTFFKAKPASKRKPVLLHKKEDPKTSQTSTQGVLPLVAAAKNSQKQSLILFEEADVLFEEDQQFWVQVTKLALNSKRPIIITCNDERQIPTHELPLAAILRLSSPPTSLASDYLLAIAGKEGHILERKAVTDLYESKHHDLRASIAELNFWCQMSVGDRKGGLEWIYQRWPRGSDVDDQGRSLRVASEGTYQSGMGWLSHNVFETVSDPAFNKEEELLQEIWADWSIAPSEWAASNAQRVESCRPSASPEAEVTKLQHLDSLLESMSAADIFCRIGLPTYFNEQDQPSDPTLPAIIEKAKQNYTLAAPVLQVDHQMDYLNMDAALATQTHILTQRTYPGLTDYFSPPPTNPVRTEGEYTDTIIASLQRARKTSQKVRTDFAAALDVLAAAPDHTQSERTFYTLMPSSFDRSFSIITTDLAPYVRSIVAHEQILESHRLRMSNLLTAGGTGKRARTTRASRVALEGGVRETKRRDRWFDAELDFELVMRTAGTNWAGLGWRCGGDGEDGTTSYVGTMDGTQDTDVEMQGSQE